MRVARGWQVMLTDLALILFLGTAAVLDTTEPADNHQAAQAASADGTAMVGVFRAGGGTSLADWLASRITDPREELTILASHAPHRRDQALAAAAALAAEAAENGIEARIVIEPAPRDDLLALFAFSGSLDMAQDLLGVAASNRP